MVKDIGGIRMPTKTIEKEQTIPAKNLRKLSQKSLLNMVEESEKIGIIANDNLSIAMLSWKKYEDIIDLINKQEEQIKEMQNIVEDALLSKEYGKDILKAEKGEAKTYQAENIDEVFNLLDKK